MAFPKLGKEDVTCVYCNEPITFGQSMEFAHNMKEVRPAHTKCNEKAYAEEAQEVNAG